MTAHHDGKPDAGAVGAEQGQAPGSVTTGGPHAGYEGATMSQAPTQGAEATYGMGSGGMYHHPQAGAAPAPGPVHPGYAPDSGQLDFFAGPGMGFYGHGPGMGPGPHGYRGAFAPGPAHHHGGVTGHPGQPVYGGHPPYSPPYPPQGVHGPWAVAPPPGMDYSISELMDDALKGEVNPSKLGRYLNDGEFVKGALVGAAVVCFY